MYAGIFDLLANTFPAVDRVGVQKALAEIKRRGLKDSHLFGFHEDSDPWQGDVIGPFRFWSTDETGAQVAWEGPGMLLSSTCDAQQAEECLLAACFPAKELASDLQENDQALKSNSITDWFFLPEVPSLGDCVITLSQVSTINTEYLNEGLKSGRLERKGRLSTLGYYVFLAKLSVHFLRPEAADVPRDQAAPKETR